jgi:hypothetical protein
MSRRGSKAARRLHRGLNIRLQSWCRRWSDTLPRPWPRLEAAVPAGLARLGATLPEFLGGAGLEAGAGFAARRAALETGTGLGKFILGGGAFGGVTGFGQAIQSADQQPGGATKADALKAAAESPLYAAAGLIEPGFLRGALSGAEGNIVTRVVSRALSGAAVGGLQSSILTGLDQTFRPDLTPQEKTSNIVDSFLTGASVGGVLGGATGVRALKRADPGAIDTDTLSQSIDQSLAPQQQPNRRCSVFQRHRVH